MQTWQKILLVVTIGLLLASCSQPRPAPAPIATESPARPTLQPEEALPPDAWFSIRATGRLSPSGVDLLVVYQSGLAVYSDQNTGKQFQRQLPSQVIDRWRNLFTDAAVTSLKDSYSASASQPADPIHYTLHYRDGSTVKTVTAQKSGAPPEVGFILDEFWRLIDQVRATS